MPSRDQKRAYLTPALVIGALFVSWRLDWLRPVTDPFTMTVSSIAAPFYRIGSAVTAMRDAGVGRETAPGELEKLRIDNAKLRELEEENTALKAALDFKRESGKSSSLSANVVARIADEPFHGFIIDRGADDGLRVGQPVMTAAGALVGKVALVRARTSGVMLLADSGSRLAVSINGSTDTLGLLEGERGTSLKITLIPQQISVTPGDLIVTSGLEPGVPRGLAVGTVEQVSRDPQDPFQTAIVTPLPSAIRPMFVTIDVTPSLE